MKRILAIAGVFLAFCASAYADSFTFTMSGPETGTFTLIAQNGVSDGTGNYDFSAVSVSGSGPSTLDFTFYSLGQGGGFSDSIDGFGYLGDQLFIDAGYPAFIPGTYSLSAQSDSSIIETLTIAASVPAATPEPDSALLLLTGVLSCAAALRLRSLRRI
jgi:hypothetical protein